MKAMKRRLRFFEDHILQKEKPQSYAGIAFNFERMGLDKVRVGLQPAHGDYMSESTSDIETGRKILERMTKDFINPVVVVFYEDTQAIQDQYWAWHNAGKKGPEPYGQLWHEILHQGRWIKKGNERK